jgi:hypothetical protein
MLDLLIVGVATLVLEMALRIFRGVGKKIA